MKSIFRLALALSLILGAGTVVLGQGFLHGNPVDTLPREIAQAVSVTTWFDAVSADALLANVQLETRNGFHIYEDRVGFSALVDPALQPASKEWKIEVVKSPTPISFFDPVSHSAKNGYSGQSVFKLKFSLPGTSKLALPPGHKIPFVVSFQTCSDKVCLLPVSLKVSVPSTLDKAQEKAIDPSAASAESNLADNSQKSFLEKAQGLLKSSLGNGQISFSVLLILFLAGLITSFTPCVYPLYPLTLGIFARWNATGQHSPLGLVLSYCAGLTLSYATLGLFSAATGSVFGSLTQTPGFLLGIGFLILLSAVFFSGLIDFPMPSKLQAFFARADGPEESSSSRKKYGQAAFMGAGLGIVAAPCVGPVLVVLLAWLSTSLAHGGALAYLKGFLLLALFGVGMSVPFLILGHFILRLQKRPSLGKYTPLFKYLGTGVMVVASLAFIVPGIQLLRQKSNPQSLPASLPVTTLDAWKKQKNSVLDFRADWCAACLELERDTFSNSEVLKKFTSGEWDYVRIDMTQMDEKGQKISQDFNVVGLPTVLITDKKGKACENLKLFGFEDAAHFLARMNQAQSNCH